MKSAKLAHGTSLDTERLIETRLLIQANSGGGKSYAIRKIVEETHGQCQQIILDVEGEFSTLREKFDFIIAGKGHDIPADPRSADLLARKILELGTSLIVDLYELKQQDRIKFVKNFLDAMINASKDLWHPVMLVLDEAHLFAPEKGHSEAMQAVTDLATRGRKRGFCAVLATQRLSKLHKDVAAELGNKLIGRTGLDIDMKRAADELGFTSKEQLHSLRYLKPGEFYAFGPAISYEVIKFRIGEVSTSHPKIGTRKASHTPPPPEKIKAILAKLVDIPKEAEEEIKDRETLQLKIRELEKKLREQPKPQPEYNKEQLIQIGRARAYEEVSKAFVPVLKSIDKLNEAISSMGFKDSEEILAKMTKTSLMPKGSKPMNPLFGDAALDYFGQKTKEVGVRIAARIDKEIRQTIQPKVPSAVVSINGIPIETITMPHSKSFEKPESDSRSFGQCERKILGFLQAKRGEFFSKSQIGAMTGYAHGSGGFNNAISKLAKAGLIARSGSLIAIGNVDVSDIVGTEIPHRLEDWIAKLGKCEAAIYKELLQHPDAVVEKQDIGLCLGYSPGSGGFNNALSRLNTLGLIKRYSDGRIGINKELLDL